MIYEGHRDQHFGHVTYSQHGEDLMLCNIFRLFGIKNPSYLDLGCHHPINISNTYLLYTRGSRGLCVDANIELTTLWKDHRPYDKILCTGVGLMPGNFTFFMYDQTSGRNTFSTTEIEACKNIMPPIRSEIQLPMVTVNEIVSDLCDGMWPQLLSCDIEGLDYEVIRSADFSKSMPTVIIVETRRKDTERMAQMIECKGYELYVRMGENLIFVNHKFYEMLLPNE